jgi:hypothetical protein
MTPRRYALCQKPVIGLLMWITSQCVFPPLLEAPAPNLAQAGSEVSHEFEVPVHLSYGFELAFAFDSPEAYARDGAVGSIPDPRCWTPGASAPANPAEHGREIPMRVRVLRLPDRQPVHDEVHRLPCLTSHQSPRRKVRHLAAVPLVPGRYLATVGNLEAQAGLEAVSVQLRVSPPHGK